MQTQVVTWAECITEPKGEVEAVAPIATVTDPLILGYASEGQFLLQEKSRAVHRTLVVGGSSCDKKNFKADIDDDIWRISEVRRVIDHKQCGFIKPVSLHELRRLGMNGQFPNTSDPKYGPHRCAVDRRMLFFNYQPVAAEDIHVDYDPYLLPFSVQRGKLPGDWQGATVTNNGFLEYIQNNGPEAEFWPQIGAIKAYTGMRLFEKLGNTYIKAHSFLYYGYRKSWESALENISGDQPNNTINDKAAAYIGPVG